MLSYGEFENLYPEIKKSRKLDKVIELFSDFHPKTKPVLRRILISQAILYNSLLIKNNNEKMNSVASNFIIDFSYEDKLKYFDLRTEGEKTSISEEEILKPFLAAFNYFNEDNHLRKLICE